MSDGPNDHDHDHDHDRAPAGCDAPAPVLRVVRGGRGAVSNVAGRFEKLRCEPFDDGWGSLDEAPAPLQTVVEADASRSILTHNRSPDVPFDTSINPYKGCEHGCIYCYARPSHAFLDLSPGLDFESRIFAKENGAELLRQALRKRGYRPSSIALGANTDPYQPTEKRLGITRSILEVLWEHRHPVGIVTKSNLVLRDVDVLEKMARQNLVRVYLSITTLDRKLARRMEPRAPTPERRLDALRGLSDAGVPTGVMASPIIPALNDAELESILEAARRAGATQASYILVRLPFEVRPLFVEWLETHYPALKDRVLNRLRDMRGGRLNDPRFGQRMRGGGEYAELLARRFQIATRRLGFNHDRGGLDVDRFRVPPRRGDQLGLFG